jgi:hypothetical protein
VEQQWRMEVEKIRQATGLTIGLYTCAESEWDEARPRFEAEGGEVIRFLIRRGTVWYIGIRQSEWSPSSHALLHLLLSQPEQELSVQDQALHWLKSVLDGRMEPLPHALEAEWQWKEPRALFLLERLDGKRHNDLAQWRQLLTDFFPAAGNIVLLPLSPVYFLLLVPLSALPEIEHTEDDTAVWLDWASSLHELLRTETMETIRVCVTPPALHPRHLAASLQDCLLLSRALQRFRSREMVAGTWQYPLEQWAYSLDDSTREALQRSLDKRTKGKLAADQMDILDALFSHHLNVSETARHLFLHRNTLLYRLDKLKEQTGLDPRQLPDAILLRLAMLFQQNT